MQATIHGSIIIIPPIVLPGGSVSAEQAIDLSPYQGGVARVYVSAAGGFEINPRADSYWQVAEVTLPPAQFEQAQTGTREDITASVATARRGAGSVDAVNLDANQWIGDVGFAWARYRSGVDYTASPAGVTWIAGARQPVADSDYLVEIVTATTVPVMEARALPLDLSQHGTRFFDLPQ